MLIRSIFRAGFVAMALVLIPGTISMSGMAASNLCAEQGGTCEIELGSTCVLGGQTHQDKYLPA